MELPGQAHRRDSGGHRQGLLHRPFGPPRAPSWSTSPRTHNAERPRSATKNHLDPQLCPRIGTPDAERIAEAARLIDAARRPLVMIGQGVILGGGEAELRAFLDKSGMPAASTLLGLSALPTDSAANVGMLGMHGNYGPNIKNQDCDLLLAVGMRFDDRVTGQSRAAFRGQRQDHPPRNRPLRRSARSSRPTCRWSAT